MRKRLITPIRQGSTIAEPKWLKLDRAASVEVTSEDPEHPIEGALIEGDHRGWRAAGAGTQVIRLVFDEPLNIKTVKVVFEEYEAERTQEYLVRWTSAHRESSEIVRQQWNFTPPTTTYEAEHFNVQLSEVTTIELIINPDIRGGSVHASLSKLRIA